MQNNMSILKRKQVTTLRRALNPWIREIENRPSIAKKLMDGLIPEFDLAIKHWEVEDKDALVWITLADELKMTYSVKLCIKPDGRMYFDGVERLAEEVSETIAKVRNKDCKKLILPEVRSRLELNMAMIIKEYEELLKNFSANFHRLLNRRREELRRLQVQLQRANGIQEKAKKGSLVKAADQSIENVKKLSVEQKTISEEENKAYSDAIGFAKEVFAQYPSHCNGWLHVAAFFEREESQAFLRAFEFGLKCAFIILDDVVGKVINDLALAVIGAKLPLKPIVGFIAGKAFTAWSVNDTWDGIRDLTDKLESARNEVYNLDGFDLKE